jgi:hypothetical protein
MMLGTAVAAGSLALGVATAGATNPPPVGGCGNGFTLTYGPSIEALLAAQTHGNVNGDGYFCLNAQGFIHSDGRFTNAIAVDNVVPLGA